jgi:hypothetical protein
MSFSPGQHKYFRPLVDAAWAGHCKANKIDINDKAAKRAWYEEELTNATGKSSTTQCDKKRDFEDAMEHFERLTGEGIYWAVRKYGADARRIIYNLREVCRENDVDEEYMRSIARRSLRLRPEDPLPELEQLSYQHLRIIMGELKRFIRRGGRPHVRQAELVHSGSQSDQNPF